MEIQQKRFGVYRSTVVANKDPEALHRVRLRVPSVLGNGDSNWAEPSYPGASVPAVGTSCWVSFNNGEINRPVWFTGPMVGFSPVFVGSHGTVFSAGSNTFAHGCPFLPAFVALTPNTGSAVVVGLTSFDATNLVLSAYNNAGAYSGTITVRFACLGTPAA